MPTQNGADTCLHVQRHVQAPCICLMPCMQNNYTSVVRPTPHGFPWAADKPLPTASATSLLGMLWRKTDKKLSPGVSHRLQCFALDQVGNFWISRGQICRTNTCGASRMCDTHARPQHLSKHASTDMHYMGPDLNQKP